MWKLKDTVGEFDSHSEGHTITANLILGLVLIESLALYTLLIVLKFTWVNPLY